MKDFNPFTGLAWLIMSAILCALFFIMAAGQIIRAVFVFHEGFCAWYIPMAMLPLLGVWLVRLAWNEYKEDK